jgi:glutathionyl-hydroquinone reductase
VSAHRAHPVPIPAFRDAFNLDSIKRGYYFDSGALNPTRIVPLAPELKWAPRRG